MRTLIFSHTAEKYKLRDADNFVTVGSGGLPRLKLCFREGARAILPSKSCEIPQSMTISTKSPPGFRIHSVRRLTVNWRHLFYVIINTHYEKRHHGSVNDALILELTQELNGHLQIPDAYQAPYAYFVSRIVLRGKQYRLVWLLEDGALYLGVINSFPEKRKLKRL